MDVAGARRPPPLHGLRPAPAPAHSLGMPQLSAIQSRTPTISSLSEALVWLRKDLCVIVWSAICGAANQGGDAAGAGQLVGRTRACACLRCSADNPTERMNRQEKKLKKSRPHLVALVVEQVGEQLAVCGRAGGRGGGRGVSGSKAQAQAWVGACGQKPIQQHLRPAAVCWLPPANRACTQQPPSSTHPSRSAARACKW